MNPLYPLGGMVLVVSTAIVAWSIRKNELPGYRVGGAALGGVVSHFHVSRTAVLMAVIAVVGAGLAIGARDAEQAYQAELAEGKVEKKEGAGLDPENSKPDGQGRVESFFFPFDGDSLEPEQRERLVAIAEQLRRGAGEASAIESRIAVTGHADETGPDEYNDDLGLRRARTVSNELAALTGMEPGSVSSEGERSPLVGSGGPLARAIDRRADVTLPAVSAAPTQQAEQPPAPPERTARPWHGVNSPELALVAGALLASLAVVIGLWPIGSRIEMRSDWGGFGGDDRGWDLSPAASHLLMAAMLATFLVATASAGLSLEVASPAEEAGTPAAPVERGSV